MRSTNGLVASTSISTGKSSIKGVGGSTILYGVDVVDKINLRLLEFGTGFFIPRARLTFAKLRQAFHIALILHYFNPDCHIRIEIDVSNYAIGGMFSQLTSDSLCQ